MSANLCRVAAAAEAAGAVTAPPAAAAPGGGTPGALPGVREDGARGAPSRGRDVR